MTELNTMILNESEKPKPEEEEKKDEASSLFNEAEEEEEKKDEASSLFNEAEEEAGDAASDEDSEEK